MKKIISILTASIPMMFISLPAFASEGATDPNSWLGYVGLGAGLAIGLAALGGSLGQGRAAAAALEGIARNPQASGKIMTPMIIGLALIESLVIYGLLIGIFLNGHIGDTVAMHKTSFGIDNADVATQTEINKATIGQAKEDQDEMIKAKKERKAKKDAAKTK